MIVCNDNQVYAYISLELLVEETEVSTIQQPHMHLTLRINSIDPPLGLSFLGRPVVTFSRLQSRRSSHSSSVP